MRVYTGVFQRHFRELSVCEGIETETTGHVQGCRVCITGAEFMASQQVFLGKGRGFEGNICLREMPSTRQSSDHNGSVSPEELGGFPSLVNQREWNREHWKIHRRSQEGRIINSIWPNII